MLLFNGILGDELLNRLYAKTKKQFLQVEIYFSRKVERQMPKFFEVHAGHTNIGTVDC